MDQLPTARPGTSFHAMRSGGRTRTFLLHLPPLPRGPSGQSGHLPLVVVLHGSGASANTIMDETGMNRRADSAGYAVVYPNGTGWLRYFDLTWDAGGCCGEALAQKVNDVEFIRELIGRLEAALPIDSARIYVTGFSDGGRLAYTVGCDLSPIVAAIAAVSGGMPDTTCRPARPVSVAIFHGTADRFIPYGTRAPRGRFFRRPERPASVPDIFRYFARADGCAGPAIQEQRGSIVEQRFAHCAEGSEVRLYTIEGGDHAWPGGTRGSILMPTPTRELDASTVMLQFFASHAR